MNKTYKRYYRADGEDDFKLSADGIRKDPLETYRQATQEQREEDFKARSAELVDRRNKVGGNGAAWAGIGNSLINNLGGIFGGIGSIIGASKGTPQTVNYIQEGNENSGIGKWLLIGGGVLVVVVVVIVLATRNK